MESHNEFPGRDDDWFGATNTTPSYAPEWYDWAADLAEWYAQFQRTVQAISAARAGKMPESMIAQFLSNPSAFANAMRSSAHISRQAAKDHFAKRTELVLPAWAYCRWW